MKNVYMGSLENKCLVYHDNVIFEETFEEHLNNLKDVFNWIRESNLKLNSEKLYFLQTEVRYLGNIISPYGIQIDPNKTKTVNHGKYWIILVHRSFIKGFADKAPPHPNEIWPPRR